MYKPKESKLQTFKLMKQTLKYVETYLGSKRQSGMKTKMMAIRL